MPATHGVLRLVRSTVLATTCLLLALTAHVLAGGAMPSATVLAVLAIPLVCGCIWVTARRTGPVRLGVLLLGSQLGLHETFMTLAHPACHPAVAGHAAMSMPAGCGPSAATTTMTTTMAAPSTAMLLAHVTAAAGLGLVLWYGERILWALMSWLTATAPSGRSVTLVCAPVPTAPVRRPLTSAPVLGGVGRRGPPVAATA